MSVYLFAEHASTATEMVAGVRSHGEASTLLLVGQPEEGMLATGADEAICLKGNSFRPEDYASAIANLLAAEGPRLLLVESTARGRELAALVAGYLQCAMFSDIASLAMDADAVHISRNTYGGAVVSFESAAGVAVATVGSGVFEAGEGGAIASVREIPVEADSRVKVVSCEPIPKEGVDISVADRIVGVGLGLNQKEDLSLIEELANVLDAEIGCTRDMAENRGWIPKDQYIGITGVSVKPSLYLAVGLSGAMQHVYGIRNAKVVVGVNKDENAAIFRAADYGIVGDLYEVVPKLIEVLAKE